MIRLTKLEILFLALVIIGGLNWGLVGFVNFDLVATLFGPMTALSRIVYALVGISAIALAILAIRDTQHERHGQTH